MNPLLTHPPSPPLAFRVGIVGHRPGRLELADLPVLKDVIGNILKVTRDSVEQIGSMHPDLYSAENPVFRAISPLAEGADRIFAEEAIGLGYELSCCMPFAQHEYEKDFDPQSSFEKNSLQEFRELTDLAGRTTRLVKFELDGNRANVGEAYRTNAQIVLNQSDLLLIIWDGSYHDQHGGTEETLLSAKMQQIPIIWIDALAPHRWQILDPSEILPRKNPKKRSIPEPGSDFNDIRSLINRILAIPTTNGTDGNGSEQYRRLSEFYAEKQPHLNFALLWKFFRNVTGASRISFFSPRISPFAPSKVFDDAPGISSAVDRQSEWLRPFYEWPDKLAEYYADRYRSGFLLTYLLASLAVGTALFPVVAGWLTREHHSGLTVCMIIESLTIITILGLVFFTRKKRWHGRWLDYRMTAESIRQLKLFLPLGGGKPFPKMAGHLTQYGNPSVTWMTWYVQSIERIAGLPSVSVNNEHLRDCLLQHSAFLNEQQSYHQSNAELYGKIDRRLHRTGELTLWLTLVACLIHLLPVVVPAIRLSPVIANGLTFLCGFLPALGASMAGINHQGEFKRTAKSSKAMYEQFTLLSEDIKGLMNDLSNGNSGRADSLFQKVTDLSRSMANLMINEVSDWKVIYQDRPPTLPA